MNYMNSQDNSAARQLWLLRLIHILFLATIPIVILVTALLPALGFIPIYDSSSIYLHLIEITFGFITIACLLFGYYWSRQTRKLKMATKPEVEVVDGHILRISLFESVAVFGFTLGILGSRWYIWLPFFILSAIALTFTFPTKKRWINWIQNQSTT